MLSHGGSLIPNFLPIIGHMIKIEHYFTGKIGNNKM